MKRFLITVAVLLVILIAGLAAIPYFFKDKIIAAIKREANEKFYTTMDFTALDLSLLRNFPNATIRLEGLRVLNKAPFEGDTLMHCAAVELTADLLAYWRQDIVKIIALSLEKPFIYAHVLQDSSANWRITSPSAKPTKSTPEPTKPEKPSSAKIALQKYTISDGTILFNSELADRQIALTHLNHSGSGDFAQDVFTLATKSASDVTFTQRGTTWLNAAKADLTLNVVMNLKEMKFTLTENEFSLNALKASFEGFMLLPTDDIEMDIRFATKNNEFKNLLSLVPAVYTSNFSELKSSGTASINGFVKGVLNDSTLPGFELRAVAENGMFQYPKLPSAVNNFFMDLTVKSPGGSNLDALVIALKRMSLTMAGDPLQMDMEIRTPISDPFVSANVKGRVNLANVRNLIPPEKLAGKEISGLVAADVHFKGNLSAVKQKRYTDFAASGQASVENFELSAPNLPEKIGVKQGTLSVSPQNAALKNCDITLGVNGSRQSNLRMEGSLENVMGYVLSDNTLKGSLNITSTYFDCNPWLKDSADRANTQKSDSVFTSIELPANVDFTMSGNMKEVKYTNLTLNEAQGKMTLRDRVLRLENVGAKLLGGSVVMNGSYDTHEPAHPKTDFNLKLGNFDFTKAFDGFESLQKFAPFAKFLKGNFGASIALATDLDGHLKPVWDSFNSNGGLSVTNLKFEDFKPLNQVADLLNLDFLKNPTIPKATPYYEIKNGRLYVKPFSFTVGGTSVMISGSNGIDKSVDYTLTVNLPANKIPSGLAASIPALGGLLNSGVEKLKSKPIPINIKVTGTLDNPIVQPSLAGVQDAASQVLDAVQEEAKKRAQEEIDKAQQTVKEEAEKKAKELEQKAKEEAAKKAKEALKDKAPSFLKNIFSKDTTKK